MTQYEFVMNATPAEKKTLAYKFAKADVCCKQAIGDFMDDYHAGVLYDWIAEALEVEYAFGGARKLSGIRTLVMYGGPTVILEAYNDERGTKMIATYDDARAEHKLPKDVGERLLELVEDEMSGMTFQI